jgi:WD40 repeat protein
MKLVQIGWVVNFHWSQVDLLIAGIFTVLRVIRVKKKSNPVVSILRILVAFTTLLAFAGTLFGCNRAAGVPIFIPAPNPIPIAANSEPETRSHQLTQPLMADSTSTSEPSSVSEFTQVETRRIPAEEMLTVSAHNGDINSLVASVDGRSAYSGGNDGLVVRTTLIGGPSGIGAIETSTLLSGTKPIQALALDPQGKSLAISQYGAVIVYDIASRKIVARLTRLDGRVTAMAWDHRGELLALGRADGGVFVWNVFKGPHAGEDSLDAVEKYNGGLTPIERIVFHPSARIFFGLEKKGIIGMWRLARTEYEMGLRDNEINPNQPQLGLRRWTFIQLPSPIEDFGITADGSHLHLILADGKTVQWKVRGLKPTAVVGTGESNSYQLAEINLRDQSGQPIRLVAVTGRTETLSFWCQYRPAPGGKPRIIAEDSDTPGSGQEGDDADDSSVESSNDDPTTVNIINEYTDVSSGITAPEPIVGGASAIPPLWRTAQLRQPLKALSAPSGGSQYLWASQKTGNLLVFKLNSLIAPPALERYRQQCKQ